MGSVSDFFRDIDFFEVQNTIVDAGFYDYLFPYLLVYSILVTILPYVKIFQNKQGKPIKSVTTLIALIVSFFGVSFEVSQGQTVAMLLMTLFPNISALTIGILALYIVGSILGVDFFKGVFRKDLSANIYLTLAGIGLAMTIYFVGISMGLWDYDPLDASSMWNVIIAVLLSILALVFFIIGLFVPGLLFAIVVFSWVFSSQSQSILMSFIDPVVFVFILFAFLLSWVNKGNDNPKTELAKKLQESIESVQKVEKSLGYQPKPYESRVFDLTHQGYLNKLKEWHEKYGEEDHRKYL